MSTRCLLRLLPGIVLAALCVTYPALAAEEERPNVIVIVADDLGWSDVGFHGEEVIETPSLDRLANEGVQLHRFYTTPICSPTRAALMTGRDPMRLGVAYGVIMPWHTNGIHPAEHFMPQSFQAAGYQTAMVGKWHLGHAQMTYHPNQRGFDHFYGHLHTEVGYFPPFANQGGKRLPAQRRQASTTRATRPSCSVTSSALDPRARPEQALLPLHALHRTRTRRSTRPTISRRSTRIWTTTGSPRAASRPTTLAESADAHY